MYGLTETSAELDSRLWHADQPGDRYVGGVLDPADFTDDAYRLPGPGGGIRSGVPLAYDEGGEKFVPFDGDTPGVGFLYRPVPATGDAVPCSVLISGHVITAHLPVEDFDPATFANPAFTFDNGTPVYVPQPEDED